MNTVPADIQSIILSNLPLETCLSVGDSCRIWYEFLHASDGCLVRSKVLERAPWFTLEEGGGELDSWVKAARVVVSRSRRTILPKVARGEKLQAIKSLEYPVGKFINSPIRVKGIDVGFNDEARESMKPLFDTQLGTSNRHRCVLEGTTLIGEKRSFDLKTLTTGTQTFDRLKKKEFGATNRGTTCVSPSGIVFRNTNPEGFVHVIAENDVMVHVRYSTSEREGAYSSDEEDDEDEDDENEGPDFHFDKNDFDCLIHKPSYPREDDGSMLVGDDSGHLKLWPQFDDFAGYTLVNLLPGAAGALVQKMSCSKVVSSYLGYIEPTADLRHVIICAIPFVRDALSIEYRALMNQFYFSYNGYLFFLWEGRLIRLWVDLGFQKDIPMIKETRVALGHNRLPQEDVNDTRCLTAVSASGFPHLGTFVVQGMMYSLCVPVQGDRKRGLDRYVTYQNCHGAVVGDLHTGKTYIMRGERCGRLAAIPFLDGDKVGFYSIRHDMFVDIEKGINTTADMTKLFELLRNKYKKIPEPKPNFQHFGYEKNDSYNHPRQVDPNLAFLDLKPAQFVNQDGFNHTYKLFMGGTPGTYRALDWTERFPDSDLDEYDNDGEYIPRYDDEDLEDEDTGARDWDIALKLPRMEYEHDLVRDSDNEDEDGMLTDVADIDYLEEGYKDAKERRVKDVRYDDKEYFRGFHQGFRDINGYTEDSDEDPYWGSNPKHRVTTTSSAPFNVYYMHG